MSSRASGEREHRRSSSTSASASGHGNDAGANGSSDPTRSRVRVIGDYALGKTLGAGSMGKVKLAHHLVTGERVAIKIVPRSPPPDPSAVGPEAQKAAAKEANKELRTVREAAMSLLVHHPYVCGMREMLVQPSQYLLVLEYVAGGQMLDYIIAHGRLRERVARKFARQIGSALSYCHANSIVHRDLKIENILISSTGDIRLIDFGLSNLYDPHSKLNTFAGSLYFAAPELLNARPYTGPEVDVWSLGVVLYVLVCGRVPFDDQSMPALHAKIKRGAVEYPAWLSADCKALLGRMLVTAPTQRATLPEVLGHPWMNLGYNSPVEVHIPDRIPLRADELDPFIVRGMAGFEFGSDNDVANKLRKILTSESYLRAVARTQGATSNSNSTFATTLGSTNSQPHSQGPSRQGSMATSGSTHSLVDPESLLDPTRGFHPLLSVYYMVREKLERERLLSGATDSLGVPTAPDAASTRSGVTEAKAAATPAPTPKGKLRVPDNIRAPAPMHLSSTATEVSGLPSPSPASATYGHSPISGVPTAAAVGSPASNTNPGGPVPKARVVGGPGSSGMMLNLQGLTPMPTAPAAANIQAPKSTAHKRSASSSTPRAPPSSSSAATPREKDARPPGSAPISTTPHKLAKKDREHRKDRDHQSFKAVSLKGTFSVATTSTKSAKHLYADVRRTLERMGIPFREIEGGFEVAHEPSIVNGRPVDGAPTESNPPLAITTDAPPQHVEGVFERWSPLGVRFEIHIVKVPILPLHGVQFRRVAGDGWQYHMLARRVLAELKL
ncbi:kinase-like domain-containing protein [Auriculariales sp. MPI-PUGE-AT-0066]|nr:kinase-like domain-containing protein [Auriculariales sp. MPI-PUGE-AT-0066]